MKNLNFNLGQNPEFNQLFIDNSDLILLLNKNSGTSAIDYFKKGNKIKIKKKNRGKFTKYCGGNVTSACIKRAKNSSNPTLRKRAIFAENTRRWKHQQGGILNEIINLFIINKTYNA